MNTLKLLFLNSIFFSSIVSLSQEINTYYGIKGGINFSKYVPDEKATNYDLKPGFYAGGFIKFKVDKSLSIQPELLFSLQGSKVTSKNIRITDNAGNPLPYVAAFDFEYLIHELNITIPIVGKLYFTKDFYMQSGPQFNFIIDRTITSTQSLIDGSDSSFIIKDGDNFEFCVFVGLGYDISESISLNANLVNGLFKGDDDIKSSVFSFGMEYSF